MDRSGRSPADVLADSDSLDTAVVAAMDVEDTAVLAEEPGCVDERRRYSADRQGRSVGCSAGDKLEGQLVVWLVESQKVVGG